MPELPEVETIVRGLNKHIIGQTIKDVRVLHKKSFFGKKPIGLKIKNISRRGKGIIIDLTSRSTEGVPYSLLIHLKMTGQLIYVPKTGTRLNFGHPTNDFASSMPSKHTRVIFTLSKGILYFNDQRVFGWVKSLPTLDIPSDPFIKKLGPEPFVISFDHFSSRLKSRPKSSIKATLLDQSVITGLGNIYTDEVLFAAGIRPTRKSASLTKSEITKLLAAIKKVLTLGIKHSGTSIINYKTPEGSPGKMQNHLKVYMQNRHPCQVCGGPISKIRLAGRGTHFCPKCQT
ncbi:MAG: DNA-formamidopyrimidine glycosylase [Patescibacteria group bacterium]|nr:DNA-formamidopyrimidine glycosylase [Patescibacteria group bacterium]